MVGDMISGGGQRESCMIFGLAAVETNLGLKAVPAIPLCTVKRMMLEHIVSSRFWRTHLCVLWPALHHLCKLVR